MKNLLYFLCLACLQTQVFSQQLYIPRDIKKAYEKGSRQWDGTPGPKYFQNRADYSINVSFDPETRLLKGYETIHYTNNSEYSLRYIVIRLYQNVFKKGGIRGREVAPEDIHDGVRITSLSLKGKKCNPETDQCILRESQTNIFLPFNCPPNSIAEIEIGWEFTMPANPNDRFGGYDDNTYFMAYWFPQVSVFDDINGWDIFDYNGVAEFYNEYGNFDVKISLPENYTVWATGVLQNPDSVLEESILDRYMKAKESDRIINIITTADRKSKKLLTKPGSNSWHFSAENVSDFAFGTSSRYIWDASSYSSINGKKVLVQSAYDPDYQTFDKVVEISKWSLGELENSIIGLPYPYPSMSVFNGSGGMEYPMIVNDHDGSLTETIFVTSHEIAHSYFPFLVGTNQRRHGWLDEGLVTMLGMDIHSIRDSLLDLRKNYTSIYPVVAGSQMDVPPIVNSSLISDNIFQLHEYMRPSLAFWILRDIMGYELFKKCLLQFIQSWTGGHPSPWDLFYTINTVTGEDYSWFFEPWFNSYAYPDLALGMVNLANDSLEIRIENIGGLPFPARLSIHYSDGSSDILKLSGKEWIQSMNHKVMIPARKRPSLVKLDTSGYPDMNEDNNSFEF